MSSQSSNDDKGQTGGVHTNIATHISSSTLPASVRYVFVESVSKSIANLDRSLVEVSLDPVCARRLQKLETFEGDEELGYPKPEKTATQAVRALLSAIYYFDSTIESPTISPSMDGEILVSWRRPGKYLVCHFDRDAQFEWVFKLSHSISGFASALNPLTQKELARIVGLFLDPSALSRFPPSLADTSQHGIPVSFKQSQALTETV